MRGLLQVDEHAAQGVGVRVGLVHDLMERGMAMIVVVLVVRNNFFSRIRSVLAVHEPAVREILLAMDGDEGTT